MGRYRARRIPTRANDPHQMAIQSMQGAEATAVWIGMGAAVAVFLVAMIVLAQVKGMGNVAFIIAAAAGLVAGGVTYVMKRPGVKSGTPTIVSKPAGDSIESLYGD